MGAAIFFLGSGSHPKIKTILPWKFSIKAWSKNALGLKFSLSNFINKPTTNKKQNIEFSWRLY